MMKGFVFKTLLFFGVVMYSATVHAQTIKYVPLTKSQSDSILNIIADTGNMKGAVHQRDLYDVIGSLFGVQDLSLKVKPVTSKPVISIVPAIGYTLQSKFALTLAGNIAFRLLPDTKISTIIINAAYTQTRQVIVPIQSSIWAHHNNYNFVGDFRFLKYPESTYGLGSGSNIANQNPMDYSFLRVNETVMKRIVPDFFLGIGYIFDYHYNITQKGPLNGAVSDYTTYGAESSTASSGITLNSLFDSRDNSINPSKGIYAAVQYHDYTTWLGSTRNWQSLVVDVRKYFKLPGESENVLALWSYDWLVLDGKPPYLDLPSNTWDTFSGTGRGYIQGRFRGTKMVYLESEYRFRISRDGLFGGVVFVNAESFSGMPGTQLQAVQPAFGPGLRLKLNKVSKTNIAIDYGIGRQGSRGLFINVGEIF
jgi:hypothetical protein